MKRVFKDIKEHEVTIRMAKERSWEIRKKEELDVAIEEGTEDLPAGVDDF